MSSSNPGGVQRNKKCQTVANARPTKMTRFGNFAVDQSARMAKRYAMPATTRGIRNDNSPLRLKLREQIASATNITTPSPYNRCEGVSFTALPNFEVGALGLAAIRATNLPSLAPSRERVAVPGPAESNHLRHQCRRRLP